MNETELRQIERIELDTHWPKAAPLIERALKYGDSTLESVRQSLYDGRSCLLLSECSTLAVVVTIEHRPMADVLFVFAVGGRLPKNWRTLLRSIEAWGKHIGCTAIESHARLGWQRKMPDYRVRKIILRKELNDG